MDATPVLELYTINVQLVQLVCITQPQLIHVLRLDNALLINFQICLPPPFHGVALLNVVTDFYTQKLDNVKDVMLHVFLVLGLLQRIVPYVSLPRPF